MKIFLKIILTLILVYTLVGKTFSSVFYLNFLEYDNTNMIHYHFPNLIILLTCIISIIFLWKKNKNRTTNISVQIIITIILFYSLMFNGYVSLFEFLARGRNNNQNEILFLSDIPNMLSYILLISFLVYYNIIKSIKSA